MNKAVESQFEFMQRGFLTVCEGRVLRLLRAEELQILVQGTDEIDIGLLRQTTNYDGFRPDQPIIK